MTVFDDVKIDSKIIGEHIYVNTNHLANHIYGSALGFMEEVRENAKSLHLNPIEVAHVQGICTGMLSIVSFLAQNGVETIIDTEVNTVDDLLQKIDKKKKKND